MLTICITKIIGCLNARFEDDAEYESRDKHVQMLRRGDAAAAAAVAEADGESDESGVIARGWQLEACLAGEECEEAIELEVNSSLLCDLSNFICGFYDRILRFCGRSGPCRSYCSFLLLFVASCILVTCSVVNILILCKLRLLKCRLTAPWKAFVPFLNTEFV